MRYRVLSILATAALSGCQTATTPTSPAPPQVGPPPPGMAFPLTSGEVDMIQSAMRNQLKDPASAIFTGATLAAKRADGEITACGTVNAKNSYGGYNGASLYIIKMRAGQVVDAAIANDQFATNFYLGKCREAGVRI